MDKKAKRNLTLRFVVLGLFPVLLLTLFFAYFAAPEAVPGTPNTPNVLKSEKDSAVSMTAKNSWYLTMLLRKVELAGRMSSEVAEGVFKRQNAFFTQDDYKKIKMDASGKFFWNPEKENATLFVCGGYKAYSKDGKVPVIGAYLDKTLLLAKRNLMPKENSNIGPVSAVYIMTDTALRRMPWVPSADNLIKTGMFTAGGYKVKPDSLFAKEEASPYYLAGPGLNKGRLEIWTEPYWNKETGNWTISYFMPLYLDETYKGVLGMDISVQKLLEMLIGRDQSKKFTYEDAFPVLISKNGLLVASSIYGYDKLKISADITSESELKNYGDDNFQGSLTRALDPKFWNNSTGEDSLGGIESVTIEKNNYYLAHFPLRTGGITFGIFIPAENLEKSAAVSVTILKPQKKSLNIFALKAGLIAAILSIIVMVILAGYAAKKNPPPEITKKESNITAQGEETPESALDKEIIESKFSELSDKNAELSALLEKTTAELDAVKSRPKGAADVDFSKYIFAKETNERFDSEKRAYEAKISELEKAKEEAEKRLQESNSAAASNRFPGQQNLAQRLVEVQNMNDGFKSSFEQLKKENEELEQKAGKLEEESRNLTNMLVRKFEEEKKSYIQKIDDLNKQVNVGAARVVELENKIKTDSVRFSQMDPSRFIPLAEVNTRIEIEKKNYILKIQQLENQIKAEQERAAVANKIITSARSNEFMPEHPETDQKDERIKELENRLKEAMSASKIDLSRYVPSARVVQLESTIKDLTNKKDQLAKQLAEADYSGDAMRRVKELESVKLDLENKYTLLLNENKKMQEALTVVEGRKKETDKQAQSLIQKVGEDQQQVKERIKELEGEANKLKAERDAAMKQYEVLRKELEETKTAAAKKPAGHLSFKKDTDEKALGSVKAEVLDENSKEHENNLLVVDDQGEIIKIFGDTLYNMGFSVYIARNAKLAKEKLLHGNYKNIILNVNLVDGDYKELFESIKKDDPRFSEKIVFFNNNENKDQQFLAGKKIIKSSILEKDIKNLMA